MTAVTFSRRDGYYGIRFDYSRAIVELIKRTVPKHARSWNPHTKEWSVDAEWAGRLAEAMRDFGCTTTGLQTICAGWADGLFRRVGPSRVPAVHRALTKVLHPDNQETGCPQLQRELNDARSELEAK
jgi:hypothetical protein